MPRKNQPYDRDWIAAKNRYKKYHPLCEVVGCGQRAEHVDHIQTVRARPDLRLDPSNMQSLCQHHHSALTMAYDRARLAGACDADGNTLDPNHPWAQKDGLAAIHVTNQPRPVDLQQAARLKRQYVTGQRR